MICLRRIVESLVAFVGGPQHCAEQITIEFPTVEAAADVLVSHGLGNNLQIAPIADLLLESQNSDARKVVCERLFLTKRRFDRWISILIAVVKRGERTVFIRAISTEPITSAIELHKNAHEAILNARSCKRNSPLVPICAGGIV